MVSLSSRRSQVPSTGTVAVEAVGPVLLLPRDPGEEQWAPSPRAARSLDTHGDPPLCRGELSGRLGATPPHHITPRRPGGPGPRKTVHLWFTRGGSWGRGDRGAQRSDMRRGAPSAPGSTLVIVTPKGKPSSGTSLSPGWPETALRRCPQVRTAGDSPGKA